MTTTDEIQRRVEQADTARSARRSAAAQQVGALAHRRAAIAEQLGEIERELGDVLAAASDVIDIDELARFTDVPAADLTRWRTAHKPPAPTQTARCYYRRRYESGTGRSEDISGRPGHRRSRSRSRPCLSLPLWTRRAHHRSGDMSAPARPGWAAATSLRHPLAHAHAVPVGGDS